jgi:prepilin-type N-terminal cleavage/methylation domain-containing protein
MIRESNRDDGFSLIELLVSVLIITVLMGAIFSFMGQSQKRYQGNSVLTESNQSARAALEVMAQEIGQAGYNPNLNTATSPLPTYKMPYPNGILYDGASDMSTDSTLEFYGDINNDGTVQYVVYSLYAPAGASTVTINGTVYTLYTLYRSMTPVTSSTNNPAYPMVQYVLYNTTLKQGPSGMPLFSYPNNASILIVPSSDTVVGTVIISLCIAVNPQSLETGIVQWYNMGTQIRPVNLAAAESVYNAGGGVDLASPALAAPLPNPSNYYQ